MKAIEKLQPITLQVESLSDRAVREMHDEVYAERLTAKERALRDKLQVLECWKACAENGFIRETVALLAGFYRTELLQIELDRRFPGRKPVTSGDDPAYWREKQDEMRYSDEDRYNTPEAI